MTEIFPADADLNALSGTVGDIGVPHMTIAQAPHYSNKLRRSNWLDRVLGVVNVCRVYMDSTDADDECSVYAGDGVVCAYAGSTNNSLTDNQTNYVYLTSADALVINTTGFPAAAVVHRRLATIVMSAGEWDILTGLSDHRATWLAGMAGGGELVKHPIDITAGAGDYMLREGGWGDGAVYRYGPDTQNTTMIHEYRLPIATLPAKYLADQDVKVVINAHVDDAGGGTMGACTIDVEVYEIGDDGTASADLCATAAQSLTNAAADYTFTVTDTALAAGDRLRVILRTSIVESADAGPLLGRINSVEIQCDEAG